ncbi:MAG TPA: cell division protein FtsB [Advenella kashmirensis]|uniref:Cell division protein FtsB n=1 Tax=Advenella kashmirensis TaxID=310575 RepID=A0A356LFV8_9BURK|nr:cell division protein FtsB [Advenella kashmirensis]
MRLLYLALMVACVAIQYPLWWGEEGWARVTVLKQQLEAQEEKNKALLTRNNAMDAEVHDLKTGTDALEDRARIEMRMIKKDETYVQILTPNEPQPDVPVSYEVPGTSKAKAASTAAAKAQAKAAAAGNTRTKSESRKPARSSKPTQQ